MAYESIVYLIHKHSTLAYGVHVKSNWYSTAWAIGSRYSGYGPCNMGYVTQNGCGELQEIPLSSKESSTGW